MTEQHALDGQDNSRISRRSVLKITGAVTLAGTTFTGTAAAQPPQERGRDRAATASGGRSTQGLNRADDASDGRAGGNGGGSQPGPIL